MIDHLLLENYTGPCEIPSSGTETHDAGDRGAETAAIESPGMFPENLVPMLRHERFASCSLSIRDDMLHRRFRLWASTSLRASERLFIPTLSRLGLGISTIDIPFSLGEDATQLCEIEEKHAFEISRLLIATDSKPHASSVLFLHRSVDPEESNLWGKEVDIAITGMMIAYGLMAQPLSAFIAKDATVDDRVRHTALHSLERDRVIAAFCGALLHHWWNGLSDYAKSVHGPKFVSMLGDFVRTDRDDEYDVASAMGIPDLELQAIIHELDDSGRPYSQALRELYRPAVEQMKFTGMLDHLPTRHSLQRGGLLAC